jgi:hypothetical protein
MTDTRGGGTLEQSASGLRVENHNNWPAVDLFAGERAFVQRLAAKNVQQIFVTARLAADDADEPFNAAVSHILDCLDSLPRRPDTAYDSLYKVIDQNLLSSAGSSRMRASVDALFAKHPDQWGVISTVIASHLPQQTADYAAARILDCYIKENPPHTDQLKQRAVRSMGRQRYDQFRDKFLLGSPGSYSLPYANRRNAGRLMRLLFKQTQPLPPRASASGQALLDLSSPANLLTPHMKLHMIMDICLATYRHERFHGEAFSPFRSSKATLKTYAHAYYLLSCAYIVILGLLELKNKGGFNIAAVEDVARRAMEAFAKFFDEVVDE